jgi:endonuclease/exonuclease/phosphatase (EEP) superfamily protein YafD
VPTVQAPDGGPNKRQPKRLELYRKHMNGLRELIAPMKASGAAVFVTGDLNVNFRKDRVVQTPFFPFATMRALGLRASFESLGEPSTGTHVLPNGSSMRLIDYVFSLQHPGVTPVSQEILRGYSSDHRPVRVVYELTPAL